MQIFFVARRCFLQSELMSKCYTRGLGFDRPVNRPATAKCSLKGCCLCTSLGIFASCRAQQQAIQLLF